MDEPLLYTQAELDRAIARARLQGIKNAKKRPRTEEPKRVCKRPKVESNSQQTALPPEALKLPPLPPRANRPPGKYLSQGAPANGFVPKIVHVKKKGDLAYLACAHEGCKKWPKFGPIGTFGIANAIYCKEHSNKSIHENVMGKRCAHDGCKTAPCYGPIGTFGSANAIYCEGHANKDIHENVVHKRCAHDGCKKGPNYGPIGTFGAANAIYCEEHANKAIHENVVDKRCNHEGCKKRPLFGPIGTFGVANAMYCKRHANKDIHEDVVSRRCVHDGCKKLSSFPNKAGDLYALCAVHAVEAGTIAAFNPHASRAACAAMDVLKAEGRAYEHEHINKHTLKWEGKEVEGLVAPHKHRPDGVARDAAGAVTRVFFYHGNLFHGFPPEHEAYDTTVVLPQISKKTGQQMSVNTKDRYEKTMKDMQLFKDRGYVVHYLWEHHHKEWKRAKGAPLLWSFVREL